MFWWNFLYFSLWMLSLVSLDTSEMSLAPSSPLPSHQSHWLFSRLNNPSSVSPSLYARCSNPLLDSVQDIGNCFLPFIFFLLPLVLEISISHTKSLLQQGKPYSQRFFHLRLQKSSWQANWYNFIAKSTWEGKKIKVITPAQHRSLLQGIHSFIHIQVRV